MATQRTEKSVNLGDVEILNLKVVETFPPNSLYAKLLDKPGVQTTSQLARGYMPGSAIAIMNGQLAHVCDFKFIFNVDINLFGGINPVTAIQKAIRGAQLKAANRLRSLVQDAAREFRQAIDALLKVLGFDPSGQLSFYFSTGKNILRKIQEVIEYIAEKVEIVLEWVFFAQQVAQLIAWIQSLPEKIKNLLLTCLKQFTGSLKQIADNIKSIPENIGKLTQQQIQNIAKTFVAAEESVKKSLDQSLVINSGQLPSGAAAALGGSANNVLAYINSTTPTATSITANTVATKMAGSQSP
jgi:hypothetical protein